MGGSVEERMAILEYRMSVLEGGNEQIKPCVGLSRTDKALRELGIALILFTASDRLKNNPDYTGRDELVRDVFKYEPNRENRLKCADEMFKMCLATIDDATKEYMEDKNEGENPLPQNSFDFEKLAFERLKKRIGDGKITIREYSRLIGAYYSLRKTESRHLLVSLKKRFPIQSNNTHVWIEMP